MSNDDREKEVNSLLKKLFRSKLLVSIFSGVVTGVLTSLIVSKVQSISIVDAMGTVLRSIYKAISFCLTFKIPVWIILLGILLIIFGFYIFIKIQDIKTQTQDPMVAYTEDIIEGIRWQWNWNHWQRTDFYGNHQLPKPICINCEGNLIVGFSNQLICRHCGFEKRLRNEYTEYHDYIRNEIVRRIRLKHKELKVKAPK